MKKFLLVLFFCLIPCVAHAAGELLGPTVTEYRRGDGVLIRDAYWKWTSTDGTASISGGWLHNQSGQILKIIAEPDAANQPDNLYDITMPTATGRDVLLGAAADLPQSATSADNVVTPLNDEGDRAILVNESFYFNGTNLNAAGTAVGGFRVIIEVWEKP